MAQKTKTSDSLAFQVFRRLRSRRKPFYIANSNSRVTPRLSTITVGPDQDLPSTDSGLFRTRFKTAFAKNGRYFRKKPYIPAPIGWNDFWYSRPNQRPLSSYPGGGTATRTRVTVAASLIAKYMSMGLPGWCPIEEAEKSNRIIASIRLKARLFSTRN